MFTFLDDCKWISKLKCTKTMGLSLPFYVWASECQMSMQCLEIVQIYMFVLNRNILVHIYEIITSKPMQFRCKVLTE